VRPMVVSRRAVASSVLCAVAVLVPGCGNEVHSSSPPAEPSASRDDFPAAVTTPASDPSAHPGAEEHRIRGTNGDDRLVGTSGRDILDGLRGADTIRGRAGNDELRDYTGVGTGRRLDITPDAFYGGPGDDLIYSSQQDRVYVGTGDDTIYADYVRRGDVIVCSAGRDVVILNDDDPGLVLTGCERVRIEYAG
jgi:hypothetical protein